MKTTLHNSRRPRRIKLLKLSVITAVVTGIAIIFAPSLSAGEEKSKRPEMTVQTGATANDKAAITQIYSFIHRIWQKSPLILAAQSRLEAARAQAKADSKWLYNPEIEFESDDTDGAAKSKIWGVSQTLDVSGKFLAASKVAKYELLAAQAEHESTRQTVALDALSALADYHAAKEIFALSAERTRLMERFSGLAQKSFAAGDIDRSEYNLAQLALSEALIEHADAATDLSASKSALAAALGFSVSNDGLLPALPTILPEPAALSDGEVEKLADNLPAIRALRAQAQAYKASISRARRERVPDPTVSLRGGSEEGDDTVGLSVSIPLNIFNSYGNEVDVAKYRTSAQEQSLASAFYAAKSRLQSTHNAYGLSFRAWNVWRQTGAQALEQQIETLDSKFKVGELSATDYLVQVQQSLNTEIAATKLHSKAWKAWFSWLAASGKVEQWLGGK